MNKLFELLQKLSEIGHTLETLVIRLVVVVLGLMTLFQVSYHLIVTKLGF
jgi:uncharacterized membrane protein YkgB